MKPNTPYDYRPLITAGTVLGMGLGGFLDGILFHQLLQTHNMLSATFPKTSIPNLEVNMFWDGLFHMFTWLLSVIGIALLWRAGKHAEVPWSTRTLVGSMLLGWGLFNFLEGIVDHYILQVHHLVEQLGLSVFDAAYVGSGVVLMLVGYACIRSGRKREALHPWHPGMAGQPT